MKKLNRLLATFAICTVLTTSLGGFWANPYLNTTGTQPGGMTPLNEHHPIGD